jgi:hypothetical protein
MSKKYHIRERMFLNQYPEWRAYIIAVIQDTREIPACDENEWKWGTIELKLGDCYDDISFEFDLSSKESRENSLHKVRELTRVINQFREALELEAESIEERQSFLPMAKAMTTVH